MKIRSRIRRFSLPRPQFISLLIGWPWKGRNFWRIMWTFPFSFSLWLTRAPWKRRNGSTVDSSRKTGSHFLDSSFSTFGNQSGIHLFVPARPMVNLFVRAAAGYESLTVARSSTANHKPFRATVRPAWEKRPSTAAQERRKEVWMLRLFRSLSRFETQDIKTQPQFNHYLIPYVWG